MPGSRPTPIAIHIVAEHVYMIEAKFLKVGTLQCHSQVLSMCATAT